MYIQAYICINVRISYKHNICKRPDSGQNEGDVYRDAYTMYIYKFYTHIHVYIYTYL